MMMTEKRALLLELAYFVGACELMAFRQAVLPLPEPFVWPVLIAALCAIRVFCMPFNSEQQEGTLPPIFIHLQMVLAQACVGAGQLLRIQVTSPAVLSLGITHIAIVACLNVVMYSILLQKKKKTN